MLAGMLVGSFGQADFLLDSCHLDRAPGDSELDCPAPVAIIGRRKTMADQIGLELTTSLADTDRLLAYMADLELEVDRLRRQGMFLERQVGAGLLEILGLCSVPNPDRAALAGGESTAPTACHSEGPAGFAWLPPGPRSSRGDCGSSARGAGFPLAAAALARAGLVTATGTGSGPHGMVPDQASTYSRQSLRERSAPSRPHQHGPVGIACITSWRRGLRAQDLAQWGKPSSWGGPPCPRTVLPCRTDPIHRPGGRALGGPSAGRAERRDLDGEPP